LSSKNNSAERKNDAAPWYYRTGTEFGGNMQPIKNKLMEFQDEEPNQALIRKNMIIMSSTQIGSVQPKSRNKVLKQQFKTFLSQNVLDKKSLQRNVSNVKARMTEMGKDMDRKYRSGTGVKFVPQLNIEDQSDKNLSRGKLLTNTNTNADKRTVAKMFGTFNNFDKIMQSDD